MAYCRNWHNILNQLYLEIKRKKRKKEGRKERRKERKKEKKRKSNSVGLMARVASRSKRS